jgi:EmrB/QacA subfamily drug resistance transporter
MLLVRMQICAAGPHCRDCPSFPIIAMKTSVTIPDKMPTPPISDPAPGSGRRREVLTALLVAAAFFMENLDGTIITTAVPAMARDFGVAPVDLNLGISAYLLTLGILIPISGWAADRFGARRIFASAIVIFTVSSLLCGFANNLWMFIALRVLQGVGGAMMVPVGRLVVLRTTPKERLVNAIAILTWPALVAPVLGPALGGFITTFASWRWIFYLNLPIGILALIATFRLLPGDHGGARRPFDWPGFLLIGGGLFCLLCASEIASRPDVQWLTMGLMVAVSAVLLAWATRHLRRADHPILAVSVLAIPTFAVSFWGGSLFRMSIGALPFLLPLLFQVGFGLDAFHAGLLMVALFAGNLVIKPFTSAVLRRFGFRATLIGNGLLNAASLAACALLGPDTPVAMMVPLLFVAGMVRSMQFTALNTVAFSDVPQPQMSAANTLFSTAFQLALGLGIAVGALAIRFSEWLVPRIGLEHWPAAPYRLAFVMVALVALAGLVDSVRLAAGAGDHIVRPTRPAAGG